MIHSWELVLNEFFWPLMGYYIGQKVHHLLGIVLGIAGFFLAEYLIWFALTHGWVVR